MATVALKIDTQERNFDIKVKDLLSDKLVPGVFYGHEKENEHFVVPYEEFRKVYRAAGHNNIVTVKLPSGKSEKVLIHEVQRDPVQGTIRHLDLYGLKMKEKLTTNIPFEFVGESNAVKNFGGVLVTSMDDIEVRCLPTDLVHHIEVDLTALENIGDAIHISNIVMPKGMEVLAEDDMTIVSVQPPVDSSTESDELPEMNVADVEVATAKPSEEETQE